MIKQPKNSLQQNTIKASEEEMRNILVQEFLDEVIFSGWNENCLKTTQDNLALRNNDARFKIIFEGGLPDLINYISQQVSDISRKNINEIINGNNATTQKIRKSDLALIIITEKIKAYHSYFKLKSLLSLYISQAIKLNILINSLENIYSFANESWNLMGDTKIDLSFYSKRLSFATIYINSLIYSLDDNSNLLSNTTNFTQRSLARLMKFHQTKSKLQNKLKIFSNILKTTKSTLS